MKIVSYKNFVLLILNLAAIVLVIALFFYFQTQIYSIFNWLDNHNYILNILVSALATLITIFISISAINYQIKKTEKIQNLRKVLSDLKDFFELGLIIEKLDLTLNIISGLTQTFTIESPNGNVLNYNDLTICQQKDFDDFVIREYEYYFKTFVNMNEKRYSLVGEVQTRLRVVSKKIIHEKFTELFQNIDDGSVPYNPSVYFNLIYKLLNEELGLEDEGRIENLNTCIIVDYPKLFERKLQLLSTKLLVLSRNSIS